MPYVDHTIWDGNNISTIHGNHGDVASYHLTGQDGMVWPKDQNNPAVFQDGLWLIAGKINGQEEIRVTAAEYTCTFIPGVPFDSTDAPVFRMHRSEIDAFLNNDWDTFSNMSLLLPQLYNDGPVAYTELVDTELPTDDFMNWPVEKGAPWVDVNNDNIYNPQDGDHPDIIGDMFHWYVMNDHERWNGDLLWGTEPLGVTIRVSMFGFDEYPVLENTVFVKWEIENSGSNEIDSLFIGWWSDTDLGEFIYEFFGSDSARKMEYIYNDIYDNYFGYDSPALGHIFLQTPLKPSIGDTALSYGNLIYDHKNLPMYSSFMFINGDPVLADPVTAQEVYNCIQGLLTHTGDPVINPITGLTTRYIYDGNPVSGDGWVDPFPGRRRQLSSIGPLSLFPGEKHDVVGSILISRGDNNILSVGALMGEADWLQYVWDNQFSILEPVADVIQISDPHNTESVGPFQMLFQIEANEGWTLSNDPVYMHYSINSVFNTIPLTIINQPYPTTYAAWIPEQTDVTGSTEIKYYLEMSADNGFNMTWPFGAPLNHHIFIFGPDTTNPIVSDPNYVPDVHYRIPFSHEVFATAEDDRFPVITRLNWSISQTNTSSILMHPDTTDNWPYEIGWSGNIEMNTLDLGDTVNYWVSAETESEGNNVAISTIKSFIANDVFMIGPWDADSLLSYHTWEFHNAQLIYEFLDETVGWGEILLMGVENSNHDSVFYAMYENPLDTRFIDEIYLTTKSMSYAPSSFPTYYVETSTDKIEWETVFSFSEIYTDERFIIDLNNYLNEDSLYIRFRGFHNGSGSGYWFLDDIYIRSDTTNLGLTTDPILPKKFALHQNYPNPFNPSTNIRFSVETSHATSLHIFDITGRLVETLIDKPLNPGEHEVVWNAKNVASGIYFYRLETPTKQITKKMVVLK